MQFCEQYSPSYQLEICSDIDQCFFGNYPTLAGLKRDYGKNAPLTWLIPQLTNLAVYCGCKDKLSKEQYKECAFVIATEFYYLKVSELMLFFHRFKSGRYGRFYGSVDPLVITTAIRDFLQERRYSIEYYEQHKDDNSPERLANLKRIEEIYENIKKRNQR